MTHWIHTRKPWREQHDWATMLTRARENRRVAQAAWMNVSDRFILCRPHGGLNDILCQVHKTFIHALQYKRQLIIDTRANGLHDNFGHYFKTARHFPSVQLQLTSAGLSHLNQLECFPNSLRGRIDNYPLHYDEDLVNYVVSDSGERPQINPTDRPEQLLIHDQCGGGRGCQVFPFLKFTAPISDEITTRILSLPRGYEAIHIRYSDVPFNYQPFLEGLRQHLKGISVVVCTDSLEVLKACRAQLAESTVYSLVQPPETPQKIHDNPGVTNPNTNADALVDLLALALAKKIHFPGGHGGYPSGFSMMAADLSNRDDLKRQLLGRKNWASLRSRFDGDNFPSHGAGAAVSS